jgi:hypothetical protein
MAQSARCSSARITARPSPNARMAICSPLVLHARRNRSHHRERRLAPALWHERMGVCLGVLGCAGRQRSCAENLVGRQPDDLPHRRRPAAWRHPDPPLHRQRRDLVQSRSDARTWRVGRQSHPHEGRRHRDPVRLFGTLNQPRQRTTWTETGSDRRGNDDIRPGGKGPFITGIHSPIVELADGRLMALAAFRRRSPRRSVSTSRCP